MFNLEKLVAEMRETIPLTRSMSLEGLRYDGNELILTVPLAPNVNDKGCAFGGSLACLATVTGWGLLRLALAEQGHAADLYIQDQQTRFLAPAWGRLYARCHWTSSEKATFLSAYAARGKARAAVHVACTSDDLEVCTMEARYAALTPGSNRPASQPAE